MTSTKDQLLSRLRSGAAMTGREQLVLTLLLAVPAIFAQLSMCLMSCIDAGMVGRLGSAQAAAVGLVSSATWVFGSLCYSTSSGFSVQIAHKCGARDFEGAKRIFRYGLLCTFAAGLVLAALAVAFSGRLPVWLGGGEDIIGDAADYFRIYAFFLPAFQLAVFCEASLISSGNLKVPSIVSIVMCVLDVVFNYLFIFVFGMGVKGAAIGTGLAELCSGFFLLSYVLSSSRELKQSLDWLQPMRRIPGTRTPRLYANMREGAGNNIVSRALNISWPLWIQNVITRGAYVAATMLVAPLGTIAIAANSFAVIAEGFCYLPGYGMQDAASSLVGQSLGAGRENLARRFSRITIGSAAAMMTGLAVLMWIFAAPIMGLLSHDPEVIALGAKCLRIEAWAELFFAISIVGNGCCVGAGDTLAPSVINLLSMWVVRIGLAVFLIPRFGLEGYWMAMATELTVKGIVFALRIRGNRWLKTRLTDRS